jgi:hypothetical protein
MVTASAHVAPPSALVRMAIVWMLPSLVPLQYVLLRPSAKTTSFWPSSLVDSSSGCRKHGG